MAKTIRVSDYQYGILEQIKKRMSEENDSPESIIGVMNALLVHSDYIGDSEDGKIDYHNIEDDELLDDPDSQINKKKKYEKEYYLKKQDEDIPLRLDELGTFVDRISLSSIDNIVDLLCEKKEALLYRVDE